MKLPTKAAAEAYLQSAAALPYAARLPEIREDLQVAMALLAEAASLNGELHATVSDEAVVHLAALLNECRARAAADDTKARFAELVLLSRGLRHAPAEDADENEDDGDDDHSLGDDAPGIMIMSAPPAETGLIAVQGGVFLKWVRACRNPNCSIHAVPDTQEGARAHLLSLLAVYGSVLPPAQEAALQQLVTAEDTSFIVHKQGVYIRPKHLAN